MKKFAKFNAQNKKNGKDFVITFNTDGTIQAYDVMKDSTKEISEGTVKRWYVLGEAIIAETVEVVEETVEEVITVEEDAAIEAECKSDIEFMNQVLFPEKVEVVEEVKEEKKAPKKRDARSAVKKDGSVRDDKFKPKLTAERVLEMLAAYDTGVKKAQLARDFEVSYRTVTCVVEGIMWKDVFAQYHDQKPA